jgi:hypothetical protein
MASGSPAPGQRVVNVVYPARGEVRLTPDISIAKVDAGYTLWLPGDSIAGMVVFIHPRRDTLQADSMITYALRRHLAVMYATTDNRLEFLFSEARTQQLEDYIHEVVEAWNIPPGKLMYCGMSLEGTRALKLAARALEGRSNYRLAPAAVAVCDAPLDMVRFYAACRRAQKLNFDPSAANEGAWVSGYLEAGLGGSPADTLTAYVNYSPYCHQADGGPHVAAFTNVPVRAYTEPDVNWWIDHRRKDYYGMNSIDMAAFVNALKIAGNPDAELITTTGKGYLPGGKRHPHSWSIVDEAALVDWFCGVIE